MHNKPTTQISPGCLPHSRCQWRIPLLVLVLALGPIPPSLAGLAAVAPITSTFTKRQIREIELGNQEVQPTKEISSVVTVQGVSGLGLLITAVIQSAIGNLTLYHAFLIINLLFMLSTSFLYFLFSRTSCVHIYIRV